MSEQPLDLASLGITDAPLPEGSSPLPEQEPDNVLGVAGKRSADAKAMDEQIKEAIRGNIQNHELACLVVDIVSPGWAFERIGGTALTTLSPMQHLLIACTAVGGTILITNPQLLSKLKLSIGGKKTMKLPTMSEARPTHTPEGRPQMTLPDAPPSQAPLGMLDMTGAPL